jgi:hypothetical protein
VWFVVPYNDLVNKRNQMTATEIYNNYYNEMESYFSSLAEELGCSNSCAMDVWYLRQRSRWTQALEDELIRLHNEGNPPNICEFP